VVQCGQVRCSIVSVLQYVAGAVGLCCGAGGPPGDTYVLQCDVVW